MTEAPLALSVAPSSGPRGRLLIACLAVTCDGAHVSHNGLVIRRGASPWQPRLAQRERIWTVFASSKIFSAVTAYAVGPGRSAYLNLLDQRCGGVFDDIDDVIPAAEREAFMSRYETAAGFAMDTLNSAPSIIPPGARVRGD